MDTSQKNYTIKSIVSNDDDSMFLDESQVKSSKGKRKRLKSHNIEVILYPDNLNHIRAFAKILLRFDYTYILHDKDSQLFEDHASKDENGNELDLENLSEEQIEHLKKPHYHVIVHLINQKEPSQLAKELKVEPWLVNRISSRDNYLCYLIHLGDRGKYQYSPDDVYSNRKTLFLEALQKVKTDSEKILEIIDIIQNKKTVSFTYFSRLMCHSGHGSFLRKNYSLLKMFVEEYAYLHPKTYGYEPNVGSDVQFNASVPDFDSVDLETLRLIGMATNDDIVERGI